MPFLLIVTGPPGAGKSTVARDPGPQDAADHARFHDAFNRISVDAPWIEIDTTDGYRPGLAEIVAFINGQP